ncbi:MAG: cyclomaltodextrinase N-terminal domain-containing protein [Ignavibacteriales bacterium]|nr:cyclomaltodextrinase N-terminal domain-containing protein [Ignavibacteriales bacterium]
MKKLLTTVVFLFLSHMIFSQNIRVDKIEPPNWWVGMKWNNVQLMVYGENLDGLTAKFNDCQIKVNKIHKIENPSYAFIDISIPKNFSPGNYTLILDKGKEEIKVTYPIMKRETGAVHRGFGNDDVMYLIMPDRFANGDTSNDSIPGYSDSMQKIPNQGRAGGDIQGIINKLDYLKDFGITAIWSTPFVENNTFRSYHGYSATDFYKIDPRLGSNELYKKLVDEAHRHGIKIILDHVANHFSDHHVWMKNLPLKDWINGTVENHMNANHHKMIFTDIHADSATIKHVEQGWFVNDMVDFNQENPFVQNYIIQNTIWWVEYSGLDGIREDTQPYNNQKFISQWAKVMLDEYPTINIVGEVWTGESDFLAAYQKDTFLKKNFNTNLPSLTDFGLRDVLIDFITSRRSLYDVYNTIAKDFLFTNPDYLLTFVDNHDLARIMYFANGNIQKAKMAYTILMTTRGIPCIFYGSEIGMVGGGGHGELRAPFPGGFPNDNRNAFSAKERTVYENDFFSLIQQLINLRRNNKALSEGKLIHYPPDAEVYYYFKIHGDQKFLIVVNNNSSAVNADLYPAKNYLPQNSKLINIFTGAEIILNPDMKLNVDGMRAEIYKVSK